MDVFPLFLVASHHKTPFPDVVEAMPMPYKLKEPLTAKQLLLLFLISLIFNLILSFSFIQLKEKTNRR